MVVEGEKCVGNLGQVVACNSSLVIVLIQCHLYRISQGCFLHSSYETQVHAPQLIGLNSSIMAGLLPLVSNCITTQI